MNKSRNMEQNSKGMTRRMSQAVRSGFRCSSRTAGYSCCCWEEEEDQQKQLQSVPDLLTSSTDRSVKQSGSQCRDRPEDCCAPVHDHHTCVYVSVITGPGSQSEPESERPVLRKRVTPLKMINIIQVQFRQRDAGSGGGMIRCCYL